MNAAQFALLQADVVELLKTDGFIAGTPPDFVVDKFNDTIAVAKLATDITAILTKYGVPVPSKIVAIINILPLIAPLLK